MSFEKIGILHIGEMGYHWARLLCAHGATVLTCARGRSETTRKRCENAQVAQLDSLEDLVRDADVIVSIVIPSAALEVARGVARAAAGTKREGLLFVDANAISPMTADAIEAQLKPAGVTFIDGCIIGSAQRLEQASVYVSGSAAAQLEAFGELGLSVRVLGNKPGQASAFKVVYAGLTKGLAGLLTELLMGAKRFDLLDEILERYEESFPGLTKKVGQGIVSLPLHAGRRSEEMAELADTFRHFGLKPTVTPSIEKILQAVAALELGEPSATGERKGSLVETINLFADRGLLSR